MGDLHRVPSVVHRMERLARLRSRRAIRFLALGNAILLGVAIAGGSTIGFCTSLACGVTEFFGGAYLWPLLLGELVAVNVIFGASAFLNLREVRHWRTVRRSRERARDAGPPPRTADVDRNAA